MAKLCFLFGNKFCVCKGTMLR